MKKFLIIAIGLIFAWSANAQSVNDDNEHAVSVMGYLEPENADTIHTAYLYLKDDADSVTVRSELEKMDVVIVEDVYQEAPWWIIFNEKNDEAIWKVQGVELVDYDDDDMEIYCDSVRKQSNIDILHGCGVAAGTSKKYTGKGVVVGIIDGGIDFKNPNFKDAQNKSRVESALYFYSLKEQKKGDKINYREFKDVNEIPEDSTRGHHGTHVAGIAAGSYGFNPDCRNDSTFYGMAPESRLVLCDVGDRMDDENFFISLKHIFKIADELKMPAVVNISIGSSAGPFDGTDRFNKKIEEIVGNKPGRIVCMSSGNEADKCTSISFDTKDNTSVYTSLLWPQRINYKPKPISEYVVGGYSINENGKISYSAANVDLWSSDSEAPTSMKMFILDNQNKDTIYSVEIPRSSGFRQIVNSHGDYKITNEILDKNFKEYYLAINTHKDSSSNRWHVVMFIKFVSKPGDSAVVKRFDLGITTVAKKGTNILANVYGNNNPSFCYVDVTAASKNFVAGGPTYAFNNMLCNDAVIGVGSYNGKTSCKEVSGAIYKPGDGEYGTISSFSSYGKDLRNSANSIHPDVCGDGSTVVSSFNSLSSTKGKHVVRTFEQGSKYVYGAMDGTSMSTPAVAGGIALWLQADPTLTVSRVRELLKQSSNHSFIDYDANKWGAGKFDALAGMKLLTGGVTLLGDANEDGKVDVADITTIAAFILGQNPPKFNRMNADVNKDGKIDVADITSTASKILSNK